MADFIAYSTIFGIPIITYLGFLTLLMFTITASTSLLTKKKIMKIPFRWHPRLGKISLAIAVIHGVLGILTSIG